MVNIITPDVAVDLSDVYAGIENTGDELLSTAYAIADIIYDPVLRSVASDYVAAGLLVVDEQNAQERLDTLDVAAQGRLAPVLTEILERKTTDRVFGGDPGSSVNDLNEWAGGVIDRAVEVVAAGDSTSLDAEDELVDDTARNAKRAKIAEQVDMVVDLSDARDPAAALEIAERTATAIGNFGDTQMEDRYLMRLVESLVVLAEPSGGQTY